jgi:thiol-disulfide isomerase/thioredoxin
MGRIRDLGRRVAARVARRVGQAELFEKPGERVPQAPIQAQPPETAASAPAPAPAAAPPATVAPAPASVDTPVGAAACTIADLAALQAALGPGGGVRVVNHWATWCIPCVEEFDLLKGLADRLDGVALLGVSWDLFDPRGDEDDIREHVENFGTGHHLGWPSLLVGESVPAETFFEAFSIDFQQIPQTWVLDDAGTVVHRVDGVLDADSVEAVLAAVAAA